MILALLLSATTLFNSGWTFSRDGGRPSLVDLPHDAAIAADFDLAKHSTGCGALPYDGHAEYASGTVVQTAATIVKSLTELGFSQAQDDRMLIVFSKAQNRTDKIIHEVRIVPESIDLASETLGSFAAELTGDREISAKVQLLLGEFLINVYRHGLASGDHRSEYGIVAESVVGDQLVVTVLDGGRNWEGLSSMTLEDTQRRLDEHNSNLADSGRGLAIMRIIANGGVSHEWISGLNRTMFRIPIKGARA